MNTHISIETSLGLLQAELFDEMAPMAVANFLSYVDEGHYNGTIFHRIVPDFVVQGGIYTRDLVRKTPRAPIPNEASNGVSNERGTLALSHTSFPDTARDEFFINLVDNKHLDFGAPISIAAGKEKYVRSQGFTVFGKLTSGLEALDKIACVPTRYHAGMCALPVVPVEILAIERTPVPATREQGGN